MIYVYCNVCDHGLYYFMYSTYMIICICVSIKDLYTRHSYYTLVLARKLKLIYTPLDHSEPVWMAKIAYCTILVFLYAPPHVISVMYTLHLFASPPTLKQ